MGPAGRVLLCTTTPTAALPAPAALVEARPTRVLWLAKGLGQGGMERLLVTHARFGDPTRFELHVAHLVDRPHSVIAELEAEGIPVHRIGGSSFADPRWIGELRSLVKDLRIDVVHAHSPLPAAVARLLRLPAAFVYTEHNQWDRYSPVTRLANSVTYGLNDRAFAVSDEVRESIGPRRRRSVETLVHGVDVDAIGALVDHRAAARRELGVADEEVLVGTVANLRAQKNYPMLLDAASIARRSRPDVRFVAVGQGPLQDELDRRLAASDLGDGFRFLGFRSDVLTLMSGFDVLCFSSSFEGLPVAFMEARALGLPVVSTAVGGLRAHIRDGVDGVLVEPDDPAALAAALVGVAADASRRSAMAEASARRADRYRAETAVARIEAAYLGAQRPAGRSR